MGMAAAMQAMKMFTGGSGSASSSGGAQGSSQMVRKPCPSIGLGEKNSFGPVFFSSRSAWQCRRPTNCSLVRHYIALPSSWRTTMCLSLICFCLFILETGGAADGGSKQGRDHSRSFVLPVLILITACVFLDVMNVAAGMIMKVCCFNSAVALSSCHSKHYLTPVNFV